MNDACNDTISEAAANPGHAARSHLPSATHIVPVRLLAGVLAALLVLTIVTVAVAHFDFGTLNLWLALAIATTKAALVILIFMHLAYDRPFHAVILVATVLTIMIFTGLTLQDVSHYEPNVQAYQQDHPDRIAPGLEAERFRMNLKR